MGFLMATILVGCAIVTGAADRPPQFLIVSFDGAGDATELREWTAAGDRLGARFTFFLSGVYLLAGDQSVRYLPPQHTAGASDIGFAIKPDDTDVRTGIRDLVAALNDADASGYEIATHFNGHFCGRRAGAVGQWGPKDWRKELDQFEALARGVAKNNGIDAELHIQPIVGTRTPCLEGNLAFLRTVLAQRGMRYDASTAGYSELWPWRDGVWIFPVPLVAVDGESFKTLASDYNFYLNQTGAKDVEAEQTPELADQMYRSLRADFDARYAGGRAPMSVAYHFESWNHGAYRDALLHLLAEVCGRVDVRCTTYRDVANWLDRQGDPVAPPTLSTAGPVGAYVIGSTSTPFVRASQCTCGPVDTPLEPTDAIRSPATTRSPSSTLVAERW